MRPIYLEPRIARLKARIEALEKELKGYPAGILKCDRNGDYTKWFIVIPKTEGMKTIRTYLPRSNVELARRMALKTYRYCQLLDLREQLDYWNEYAYPGRELIPMRRSDALLMRNEFRQLIPYDVQSFRDELLGWQSGIYLTDPEMPEDLSVPTLDGGLVRTEGEALIADTLYEQGILYRYRAGIVRPDGNVVYPTFLTKDPLSGEEIPWEHLSGLENGNLLHRHVKQLQQYDKTGYVPMVDLIMTYETKERPLPKKVVSQMIDMFLR